MSSASAPPSPALYLVDGYALIYRAFFALLSRPLRTARGENTSVAWGVANFLQRLRVKYRPDYVAWIHDSGLSFRHELLPQYKATREKLTTELQADFDRSVTRVEQLLEAFRVPLISVEGFEADDVIGTLAKLATSRGINTVIVSGDKDFQQVVAPAVWLLNPGRGGPAAVDEQFVGMANASERLGVLPEYATDYLAMVGDTSDNVPGVPGIGEKTARELITTYGGLEEILLRAGEITKKRPREALLANGDQARLSKHLVTLRYDVPVTLEPDSLRAQPPDLALLRPLLLELEFNSLLNTFESAGNSVSTQPRSDQVYQTVRTADAAVEVVKRIQASGQVAVAVHAVGDPDAPIGHDPLRSKLVGIAFAITPGEAWYLPFGHHTRTSGQGELLPLSPVPQAEQASRRARGQLTDASANLPPLTNAEMKPVRAMLEDALVGKTCHDAKFAHLLLSHHGSALNGIVFDPMLASYVLDPGKREHSLELLSLELLEHSTISQESLQGKGKDAATLEETAVNATCTFTCERADTALRLRVVQEPLLDAHGLSALCRDIEFPLIYVLADMEQAGIAIDIVTFRALKQRFQRERERVEREIHEAAGEEFNINSNPQLRTILFEKLQLPIKKRTATGPSTDASVLQELADEGHALPSLLMEYRELSKLESTYLDTLPLLIHPSDGRLHTSFNQTVAATGRLSSSDPNLQNIPIRRELGRDIRRGFIAAPGYQLLAADYSQIELRLLAHLSRDEAFVRAFSSGGDIHRETAAIIFGVETDAVNNEMRSRAKTINFATIYGQGAHALARQLKISFGDAKAFIGTYFERFAGVRAYLDGQVAFAREHGYVETVLHRRRYIPELKDRNFNIRAFGERVATNAPIQGSAADLIKVAMIRIHDHLARAKMRSRMLLQVHDELVFEVPLEEIQAMTVLAKREMEEAVQISVPLVVDIGVGDNWLDTK